MIQFTHPPNIRELTLTEINIRKYQPGDEPAIQDITYQTGFKGQDLEGRNFIDDQRLWFMIFIYYYVRYEPEHCFVAVDAATDRPIGFICGTPDTHSQSQRFQQKVIPRIIARTVFYTSLRYPGTFLNCLKMTSMLEIKDPAAEAQIVAEYPGHLHINLLPDYHRQGFGSQLLTTFEDHLRALGVPGLHLGTSNYNHKAVPFYEKHGYRIVRQVGPVRHPILEDLNFLTFAKSLKQPFVDK
jgi:ribosomal protein S18 acetylase RimI-like enzyme